MPFSEDTLVLPLVCGIYQIIEPLRLLGQRNLRARVPVVIYILSTRAL